MEGIVRPKQDRLGDAKRERVIPLLIHGDAAFAGQGVVAETFNLSQLDGYRTGGTIHIVLNNQIGFTTLPVEARSTPYCTDVARGVQAPIFHVNGDDPEAAIRLCQIAFDYRQQFKKDVVIDMICYRRHGHNEGDDPSYTQPILYRKIKEHPSVATIYADRLGREGVLAPDEVQAMRRAVSQRLSDAHDAAQKQSERYELQELSAVSTEDIGNFCPRTAVNHAVIERVVRGITSFPENFHLHPKLRGFVERRREALAKDGTVDWAFGEALAFGTLVLEGTAVRLSGQDTGRGTFSQRHLAFYDSETSRRYVPLQHISPEQARFDVYDSSLSEYAVLGFEFGYSVADPLTLVIWEAQFGDFANGAQIMIDQFITSAESKWGQPSGLVMLLPHGYEGQGPEHSSARLERFLTLCAENNMLVCNCHHAGAIFPSAAPPDVRRPRPARHAQAARDLHAQEPAAPSARRFHDPRFHDRRLHRDRRRYDRAGENRAGGLLFRQTLLRPAGGARRAQCRSCRAGAGGAALSVRGGPGERRSAALSDYRRGGLGAGGAAQYGPVAVSARVDAAAAREHRPRDALRGASRKRQPGHRVG